jgi:hypothetical protein
MSTSPHNERNRAAPGATDHEQAGEVSRRTILTGAMATSAIVAVGSIDGSAHAQSAESDQNMMAFLLLSAALTGVHVLNLAPEFTGNDKKNKPVPILEADPGVDPINIKNDYFKWINTADPANFAKLLQIAKDHPQSASDIITGVNATDDTKFLARSIVLLWYLGSWYKPEDLKKNSTPGTQARIDSQVVSAKAYTQGLVWQIAQAHPMGYSNLQFGYWSREPDDPNDPNARSSLGFITPTIP